MKEQKGRVCLVGAGPYNLDLLTIGGKKEILKAEVVVYDRLVSKDVLNLIPKNAEKIDVGKNSGNHPVKQEEINEILLKKALEGKNVVRLKGGDSFLFGRGGEELELLKENDIKFKVVPGISSSLSVPTYAGIPVTHRNYCSSLHIITGHKKADGKLSLDYNSLVSLEGTLVFMMSISSGPTIMEGLLNAGIDKDKAVAIIENGTSPMQKKVVTTVSNLKDDIVGIKSPAIIVVGDVCALDFDWFSKLPLFGKKILVTQPEKNAMKMYDALSEQGADVKIASSIETSNVDFSLPDISKYNKIIFTSKIGVESFFEKCFSINIDARKFSDVEFATIGNQTKKSLLNYGICSDFTPLKAYGVNFAIEMIENNFISKNDKILIVRGNLSLEGMQNVFNENNILFDEIISYETSYLKFDEISIKDYEYITFTSVSGVDSFVNSFDDYNHLKAFCIGDITKDYAIKHGFDAISSKQSSIDSLVQCVIDF